MEKTNKKFSILIPCYNEGGDIEKTTESIFSELEGLHFTVIFIYDKSTDNTLSILKMLKKKHGNIKIIERVGKKGLGRAIRDGIKAVETDAFVLMVADLADDPKTIRKMLGKIGEYDIVIGSRFIKNGRIVNYPILKRLFNALCNNTIRLFFGWQIYDYSNSFKMFKKNCFDGIQLTADDFAITVEMFLKPFNRKKLKVAEVPTVWTNRRIGDSKFGAIKQVGGYLAVVFDEIKFKLFGAKK